MSACACVHAYVRIWFELEVSVAYGNAEGLRDSFSKEKSIKLFSFLHGEVFLYMRKCTLFSLGKTRA